MNHLMLDLETMGTKPNAPIVSIGAVFFNPENGQLGKEFYTPVSIESAINAGAVPCGKTISWWLLQSLEARSAICTRDALDISEALSEFSEFIYEYADDIKSLKVWGNGATFDNVIIRQSYERSELVCPWEYWGDHDVRTMVTLGLNIGFNPKHEMPFDGDVHNALADAKHQAKYVSAIWQVIFGRSKNDLSISYQEFLHHANTKN